MKEKPYIGLLGYTTSDRPVLLQKEMDTDNAKDEAAKSDLTEFVLVPSGDKRHNHIGYIRNGKDRKGKLRYEKKTTRLAVFRHLLSAGVGEVPSKKDVGL